MKKNKTPAEAKQLRPKEAKFVEYYCTDPEHNGTKAYLAAYPKASLTTARTNSSILRKKPHIAQAIDKKIKEEQETFENEHKESLKELLDLLCNTSIKDFYDDKGEAIPLSELGKKAQLINKVIHKAIGTGENAKIIIEYEFIPKEKIIDMLMKRYGLYKAEEKKIELTLPVIEVAQKKSLEDWGKEEK